MCLQDRIAVVTGGSSGIGRGICLELAREGAKVAVADMQEAPKIGKFHETEPQPPTAKVIVGEGGEALFVETDVADEKAVENLIARSVERFGGVDILVNNAGIIIPGDSQELSVEGWDRVIGDQPALDFSYDQICCALSEKIRCRAHCQHCLGSLLWRRWWSGLCVD